MAFQYGYHYDEDGLKALNRCTLLFCTLKLINASGVELKSPSESVDLRLFRRVEEIELEQGQTLVFMSEGVK